MKSSSALVAMVIHTALSGCSANNMASISVGPNPDVAARLLAGEWFSEPMTP